MVTVSQVQRGVTDFIDREIVPHLTGFEKIVVGGGGALIANKLPEVMDKLMDSPVVSALDLYDKNSHMVDIDAIYTAVKPYISTEPFAVKIPVAGVTLRMGPQEVSRLYNYIKEA
ncbi:MAG: hypothetical protein J6J01_00580 [Oscillospiraceae bacterium]|nr:hypothetical protein [Oscillospiraceae bacterium]